MTVKLSAEAVYNIPPTALSDATGRARVTITNAGTETAYGITLTPVDPLGYPYGDEYGELIAELGAKSSVTIIVAVHFLTAVENAPAVPEFTVSAAG